ncbi:MAG: peptidase S10 [Acidobacteriota bacterium]
MTIRATLMQLAIGLVLSAFATGVHAEEHAADARSTTDHGAAASHASIRDVLKLEGAAALPYTVTAEMLPIQGPLAGERGATVGDASAQRGEIFALSYVRNDVDDPSARPVLFAWNGGPGGAAVWVNFGAFGPKKVALSAEGWPLPPPGQLIDNPHTLLDRADLVFLDPIDTGFSRTFDGHEPRTYHSVDADVEAVAYAMHRWLSLHDRWASPLFLAGESYGTTRAAALSMHLHLRYGMQINGIVLIAPILNWPNIQFAPGNDTPYLTYLPSYAATAWYHQRLSPALQQRPLEDLLDEVERFTLGDYASALLLGDRLDDARRRDLATIIAKYIGLTEEDILAHDLRITLPTFRERLLESSGQQIGRLDSRFVGVQPPFDEGGFGFDPSLDAVTAPYVPLVNDYLRRVVGFDSPRVYRYLSLFVHPWRFSTETQLAPLNVAQDLRQALARNPYLHVLFVTGYYDFATPYFDSEHIVAHLGLADDLRDNVQITYHEAGHMMYIRAVDHAKFDADLDAFFDRALGQDARAWGPARPE